MSDLTQAQKTNIICFLFHVDVHFETLMCVSVQIAMEVRYLIREQRQWVSEFIGMDCKKVLW